MHQKKQIPSKTQTSFLRRLLVAYLIDIGVNTVPKMMKATGMPRRTAQASILGLCEVQITASVVSRGSYSISDWGAVNKEWIKHNLSHIGTVLSYPDLERLATDKKHEDTN